MDLRNTELGDSEICCFSSTQTLTHIYLECPKATNCGPNEWLGDGQPITEDQYVIQVIIDPEMRAKFERPRQKMYRYILQYIPQPLPRFDDPERCLISDRAVCALGAYDRRVVHNQQRVGQVGLVQHADVILEDRVVRGNSNIKTIVVR